jgi:hypothetical protein
MHLRSILLYSPIQTQNCLLFTFIDWNIVCVSPFCKLHLPPVSVSLNEQYTFSGAEFCSVDCSTVAGRRCIGNAKLITVYSEKYPAVCSRKSAMNIYKDYDFAGASRGGHVSCYYRLIFFDISQLHHMKSSLKRIVFWENESFNFSFHISDLSTVQYVA